MSSDQAVLALAALFCLLFFAAAPALAALPAFPPSRAAHLGSALSPAPLISEQTPSWQTPLPPAQETTS